MSDLHKLSLKEARDLIAKKEISSAGLVADTLKVIEEKKHLNAYLEVFEDALDQAKAADAAKEGQLRGIPLAIKDNILIEGRRVSAASKILEGYRGSYDATAIEKLRREGAIFVGRTNMDEFAMGGSTENSAYGKTLNPVDESRVPGGSSGGSAAAVAMEGATAALGSDTGGSVRQPSSFCGVVGLKPTYGAISRYGLIAMGSSLDQIGPIGKTVEDVEILFNVLSGRDPLDATSIETAKNHRTPKTIGVPYHFLKEGIDEDVRAVFDASLKRLEQAGYTLKEIELPSISYALPVYYILMPAEASTNLARFDGVRYGLHKDGANLLEDYKKTRGEGFGEEVRRRIILGTYVLSAGYYDAYYRKANDMRNTIRADYERAFAQVDVIATPTTPGPAFKIGAMQDPLALYLEDIFTVPSNLTGMPAISIPSGTVEREGKNLPLGLQLVAPHGGESALFAVGGNFEKSR